MANEQDELEAYNEERRADAERYEQDDQRTTEEVLRDSLAAMFRLYGPDGDFARNASSVYEQARVAMALPSDTAALHAENERLKAEWNERNEKVRLAAEENARLATEVADLHRRMFNDAEFTTLRAEVERLTAERDRLQESSSLIECMRLQSEVERLQAEYDEAVQYVVAITGTGAGLRPVSFLVASHREINHQRRAAETTVAERDRELAEARGAASALVSVLRAIEPDIRETRAAALVSLTLAHPKCPPAAPTFRHPAPPAVPQTGEGK